MANSAKPIYRRVWFWLCALVALLIVAVSVALDPLAAWATRKTLGKAKDYNADFSRVHVSLPRLSFAIDGLKLVEKRGHAAPTPFFFAEHIEARLLWRELLGFHIGGAAEIARAKVNLTLPLRTHGNLKLAQLDDILRSLVPFKVARVSVRQGELTVIDTSAGQDARVWLHEIELTMENLANRRKLEGGKPATFAMRATLQRSGTLEIFATASPLLEVPAFAGQAQLKGLELVELAPFLDAYAGLNVPEGQFDCLVAFKSQGGRITGGIEPVLKNVKVTQAESGFGNKLKAALADVGVHLGSDRVPGRNAVATTIPIRGRFDRPDVQIVPAIAGVIRNAFVEGFAERFANLPPPAASHRQGAVSQLGNALSAKKQAPKSQPPKKESR